jgi:hypothetical protein
VEFNSIRTPAPSSSTLSSRRKKMMADGTGTEREEQDWVLLYGQAGERWCVWGLNIGGERDGWEGKRN